MLQHCTICMQVQQCISRCLHQMPSNLRKGQEQIGMACMAESSRYGMQQVAYGMTNVHHWLYALTACNGGMQQVCVLQ